MKDGLTSRFGPEIKRKEEGERLDAEYLAQLVDRTLVPSCILRTGASIQAQA